MSANQTAILILRKQFAELAQSAGAAGFSVGLVDDDLMKWRVAFTGPPDSPYEGGILTATLKFPDDFPNNPPEMVFVSPMFHPNVYPDGKVCISILHPPGTDVFNEQESADERWRPIISVESIILSVQSMLDEPNLESPANVDAAKMMRERPKDYKRKIRRMVEDDCYNG
eukprot:Protomagalhaensia_wolfi_Nauph_80__3951@NODE_4003_length_660_cov_588_111111_g3170_i0_p1_GENE_NODE_4003_length_660_cov_588_111111_g3170_i0NODE_4003_length_660_cov_588_111111_g3170_i0_p1_ORF_typecomplete_len170_score21_81UQ_con/PF00179_26/1_2e49ProkE2_B/PF14461_6/7_1e06_NODE_4003_length_660_cov_588_111111_g3170_i062571